MKITFRKAKQVYVPLLLSGLLLILVNACKKDYKVVASQPPFNHQVSFNYEYDISGLNDTMHDDSLTADIVIFHSDNVSMTWNQLKAEFKTADAAFRAAGVQLNLKKAVNVSFPDRWNDQIVLDIPSLPDSGQALGFYDKYFYTRARLTGLMDSVFTDFTYDEENKGRTIFIIPLSGVEIIFAEQKQNGVWQIAGPVATGAMSFPGYIYHDRIPYDLRGCITMEQASGRTLAHELGHKLINVSHEGLSISPAFSGSSIPGLLGYDNSVEIYGGQSGRWHRERLLLSPYLYKTVNGQKAYNPDYGGVGAYDDVIYGSFIMPQ